MSTFGVSVSKSQSLKSKTPKSIHLSCVIPDFYVVEIVLSGMPVTFPIFGRVPTFFGGDHFCESFRTVEKILDQKVWWGG